MTDSHADDDRPRVDALLVDAANASVARSTAPTIPSADVAPELHEVTDA